MDFGLSAAAVRDGIILYILFMVSLCLRAYAQAWWANRLGDHTPQQEGRLTLNPLPHMDLMGSVILPLICIFYLQPRLGQLGIFLGWAKPVPINPAQFENPSRGYLQTQLANPITSLLLALIAAVIGGALYRFNPETQLIFFSLIGINASLVVIDLLPIPPLPGGLVLKHMGMMSEETFWNIARWSGLVLIIAFQLPPVRMLLGFLIGLVATPFALIYQVIAR